MSRKINDISLEKKEESKQKEGELPNFLEKQLDSDWDRELFDRALRFQHKILGISSEFLSSREQEESLDEEIENFISEHKLKKEELLVDEKGWESLLNLRENIPENLKDKIKEEWKFYVSEKSRFSESRNIISEALYVLLFTRYEGHLEKLFDIFYRKHPKNSKLKNIPINEIDDFTSIEEVEKYVHEQRVRNETMKKTEDQLTWMFDYLDGFKLPKGVEKMFDQFYGFRNCIVHNDSILNRKHVELAHNVLRGHPLFEEKDLNDYFRQGERLEIQKNHFLTTHQLLCVIGHQITWSFWEAISKSENIFSLNSYILTRYVLSRNFKISSLLYQELLASKLMKANSEKGYSDFFEAVLLSSLSLKKTSPLSEDYLVLLNTMDWTDDPLSENYLSIKYGILDDVEAVINIMKSIGLDGTINFLNHRIPFKIFLTWPFFDDIREHQKFKKAYFEIFREDPKVAEIYLEYFASEETKEEGRWFENFNT